MTANPLPPRDPETGRFVALGVLLDEIEARMAPHVVAERVVGGQPIRFPFRSVREQNALLDLVKTDMVTLVAELRKDQNGE